jgi:hypothetical protein
LAADKLIQAINRAHRLTSRKDVNVHVILCDQSADRVLEDNVNEKVNSSELAIDGRLLGEESEEKSVAELLAMAMADFKSAQDCPNERLLMQSWPELRQQLADAAKLIRKPVTALPPAPEPAFDLGTFIFPANPAPCRAEATAKADVHVPAVTVHVVAPDIRVPAC